MIISVVIPTYNASPFIRETLTSVFTQTRLPDEIIVVDDCSHDDTVAVVEEISKVTSIRICVIRLRKNSGGPAHPLNVGIDAAKGRMIATLDHDDRFAPKKIADQIGLIETYPDLSFVFGDIEHELFDGTHNRLADERYIETINAIPQERLAPRGFKITSDNAVRGILRSRCFVLTCSNMLFTKSVWKRVGGFDRHTTVSSDMAFLAAIAMKFDIGYLPSPSAIWKIHTTSFYQLANERSRIRDILRVYDFLSRRNLPTDIRQELHKTVRAVAFEAGYNMRKANEPYVALECLTRAIRITGLWGGALLELSKLISTVLKSALQQQDNKC
jgi:glycosyltransferase involved in cell wall biosynthesis